MMLLLEFGLLDKIMIRCVTTIPVSGYRKEFCDYMGYQLVSKEGDSYYYKIPAGHVCRLHINAEMWRKGLFNKEKFIAKTEV